MKRVIYWNAWLLVIELSVGILFTGAAAANVPVFLNAWGTEGTGGYGQFMSPIGIAIGPGGEVYVTDKLEWTVQRFDAMGNWQLQWGGEGSGNGQFLAPAGIAVDRNTGKVYVADETWNGRIQRFDANGLYEAQFGTGDQLVPYGVAVSRAGNIYVTDRSKDRVQMYTPDGYWSTEWHSWSGGSDAFTWPTGLTVTDSDRVYVADQQKDRVYRFDLEGNYELEWGSEGPGPGEFQYPDGVAASKSGYIYVVDYQGNRIQRFDYDGNWRSEWGSAGTESGQFSYPWNVAVNDTGLVYVTDTGNHRVQRFFDYEAWSDPATHYLPGSIEFDSTFTLNAGKTLSVPETTAVSNHWLHIAGGGLYSHGINLNGGTLRYESGTLSFDRLDGGLLYVDNGSPLEITTGMSARPDNVWINTDARLLVTGGEVVAGGTVDLAPGAVAKVTTGELGSGIYVYNNGDIHLVDPLLSKLRTPSLENRGVLRGSGHVNASLINSGEVRVSAGERLRIGQNGIDLHSNSGRIEAIGNLQFEGPAEIEFDERLTNLSGTGLIAARNATLRFNGGLTNQGSLGFSFGTSDVFGDIASTGNISVVGGAEVTFYDDVNGIGGELIIAKLGNTTSKAVIFGSFNAGFSGGGELYAFGDLRPGQSPAAVTMGGDLFLGNSTTTAIEIGGPTPGSQHDAIHVTGRAQLDGTLVVSLIDLAGGSNVFHPQLGKVFEIVSAVGGISGSFTGQQLPDLGLLLDMRLIEQPNDLLLAVVPALAGDYNANGVVDAADFTVWRDALGATGVGLAADGSGLTAGVPDGVVDQIDYEFWKSRFGMTAGGGAGAILATSAAVEAVIPEPAIGWLMLTLAAILAMANARRCRVVRFLVVAACWAALWNAPQGADAALTGHCYNGWSIVDGLIDFSAAANVADREDPNLDYWDGSPYHTWRIVPGSNSNFGVEWVGFVRVDQPGQYGFGTISDDGSQVWIDDALIVDNYELQWYDWEDNINEGDTPGASFPPLDLVVGYHSIRVRWYEQYSFSGIELWWLTPGAGTSDIPYYGQNFHGINPIFNPNTNWAIVPASNLFTAIPALLGDYSANGAVDTADYTVWRDHLGSPTSLPNDDTLGVGHDDYTRWTSHFGQFAGGGTGAVANAQVAEPTSTVLLLCVALGWSFRRNTTV